MKRYNLEVRIGDEHPHGKWVRYDDVSPLLAALRFAIENVHYDPSDGGHNWVHDDYVAALRAALAKVAP